MRTFSLISQKGGAGKFTLARQLAVIAGEHEPSILIDREMKGTAARDAEAEMRAVWAWIKEVDGE